MPRSKDDCVGCLDAAFCTDSKPSIVVETIDLDCPCIDCLVKMICEDSCSQFRHYIKLIKEQRYENRHERKRNEKENSTQ